MWWRSGYIYEERISFNEMITTTRLENGGGWWWNCSYMGHTCDLIRGDKSKGDLVAGGEQDVFLAGSSTPASVFLPGATLIHIIFMEHTITIVQIVKYCTQCALEIIQSMSRMKLSYNLSTICSLIMWGMDVHGQRQRVAHSFLLRSIGIKYRRFKTRSSFLPKSHIFLWEGLLGCYW